MSDNVHWIVEIRIKPGALKSFKTLVGEAVAATKANEPDTLNYEWFISDDETTCHIYERYADSEATLKHLASFGENFAERYSAMTEPVRFVVYGNQSDELRQILDSYGAEHMGQVGGFAR